MPASLDRLWQSQLHRIAGEIAEVSQEEVLATLEVAAALGQNVADNEWREVCSERGLSVPEGLAETLTAHQLLIPNLYGWSFCHTLLRESLEQRAKDGGRWRDHQRACAKMLEKQARTSDAIAGRLGQHLLLGGDLDRALDALLRGARAARRSSDFHRAHGLLDLRDEALDNLGAGPEDTRRIAGWIERVPCYVTQGNLTAAEQLVQRALATGLSGTQRAQIEVLRGTIAFARGDTDAAVEALREALGHFEADDELTQVDCLTRLGSFCMWRRELSAASRYFRRAQEIIGDDPAYSFEQGQTLRGLAHVEHCQHNFEAAVDLLLRARESFTANHHRFEIASCTNDLGELARHQGEYEKAEHLYLIAEAMFDTLGVADASTARCNRALNHLERRQFAQAQVLFDELMIALSKGERRIDHLWARAGLLACAAAEHRWRDWDEHFQHVEQLLAGGFVDEDLAFMTRLAGELASKAGHERRAREALKLALGLYQQMDQRGLAEEITTALEDL
jgi:tetratricopeptide (TPR) repeat protein